MAINYKNFERIKIKRNKRIIIRKIENPFKDIFKLFIRKNSIKSLDFIIYPSIKNLAQLSRTKFLEKENFYIYNEMKNNSKKGIYRNMKILELNNVSCIQAFQDIEANTLLFEVGGEILLNSQLNEIYCILKMKIGVFSIIFQVFMMNAKS